MPGSFDFLHIKRHTAGSSNELSFDVLDAARSQLDGKSQKGSRAARTPGASKGSYHGVAGTSTLSAVPEVERRKKLRRARAIRVRILATLVVIAAIGGIAFAGYSFYQSRVDFSDRYNSLVASLSEADEALVKVDEVMGDLLSEESVAARAEAATKIDWIAQRLDAVSNDTESTIAYAMGDRDTVALTQLDNAIEGRKQMLAAAKKAFEKASEYDQDLQKTRSAWNEVLNSDQLAREASASANNASTDEATEAAKQKTIDAMNGFMHAKESLESVKYKHETLDLSAQVNYLDKRIESLEYAIATSDALIAGDRTAATTNNEAYNEADQEAAHLAQELPLLLDDLVKATYRKEMASTVSEYNEIRAQVAEADADIRAYLSS